MAFEAINPGSNPGPRGLGNKVVNQASAPPYLNSGQSASGGESLSPSSEDKIVKNDYNYGNERIRDEFHPKWVEFIQPVVFFKTTSATCSQNNLMMKVGFFMNADLWDTEKNVKLIENISNGLEHGVTEIYFENGIHVI